MAAICNHYLVPTGWHWKMTVLTLKKLFRQALTKLMYIYIAMALRSKQYQLLSFLVLVAIIPHDLHGFQSMLKRAMTEAS